MRHNSLDWAEIDALSLVHHYDFVVKIEYFLAGLILGGHDAQAQCSRNNAHILCNVQCDECIEALGKLSDILRQF